MNDSVSNPDSKSRRQALAAGAAMAAALSVSWSTGASAQNGRASDISAAAAVTRFVEVGGRKLAYRSYEYGLAETEHVISGSETQLAEYRPAEGWKDLLVDYVDHGDIDSRYQGHAAIADAHEYRAKALRELPITAQSLMKGEPVIPTEITVL